MTDTVPTPAQSESERDTHTSAPVLNVYQRRNLAKRIVREASFSKVKGEGLKYTYLPVDQIKPVVESAWNDVGIVMDVLFEDVTDVREPTEKVSQYTGEKSMWYHKRMKLGIALVNVDNPEDRYQCVITGEAKDNSDKTWNKLYTAALKNFYKIEYNISERKDDTDELQDEAMIEQANARKGASQDAFFSGKKKKPSESRETEQMRQTILTVIKDKDRPQLAETFNRYRVEFGLFRDWSDEIVSKCYNEIVAQAGEVRE